MALLNDSQVEVRNAIIKFLLDSEKMPSAQDLVEELSKPKQLVVEMLGQLHNEHALFLDKDGSIRMLWPFSGVPTAFTVTANNRNYWANCAWDALGIPAALHTDAVIHGSFAFPEEPVTIYVQKDTVTPDDYLVHFPLPIGRWYDDLIYT